MVEVTDQDCQAVTLSYQAETQTNIIEKSSVSTMAKPPTPPALFECGSQTLRVQYQDSGTQMTPPIKETVLEIIPESPKPESIAESDAETPIGQP